MTPGDLDIGKDNFGFVAKYKKNSGARGRDRVPVQGLRHQLPLAHRYDWLVVTDDHRWPEGRYQGTGTINGAGTTIPSSP